MTQRPCGCPEARARQLEDYLHNELCSEDAEDIRAHMEICPECRDEHKVGLVLQQAVARVCRETAPEQLRVQVLASLRVIQAGHATSRAADASASADR
ncbi:MAG TPA: alpha-ketoglutarate decarboxylase [Pseudoclavibacter sp.]|nr:alpha-ketoglutarate decarboxylase [Pseudoclavibacter sp.]